MVVVVDHRSDRARWRTYRAAVGHHVLDHEAVAEDHRGGRDHHLGDHRA